MLIHNGEYMTEIIDFESFLEAARQQAEPQRLLFVFLKAVLPEDYDAEQESRFQSGEGGALLPVMYVDKTLEEVPSFHALVEESRQMGETWQLVLVAAMAGRDGRVPSSEAADDALKTMVKTVHAGGDLSAYLAFNAEGEPVRFS